MREIAVGSDGEDDACEGAIGACLADVTRHGPMRRATEACILLCLVFVVSSRKFGERDSARECCQDVQSQGVGRVSQQPLEVRKDAKGSLGKELLSNSFKEDRSEKWTRGGAYRAVVGPARWPTERTDTERISEQPPCRRSVTTTIHVPSRQTCMVCRGISRNPTAAQMDISLRRAADMSSAG